MTIVTDEGLDVFDISLKDMHFAQEFEYICMTKRIVQSVCTFCYKKIRRDVGMTGLFGVTQKTSKSFFLIFKMVLKL